MSEAYLQEIQKVELDLLEKFISVCKKYNIMYYADAGTLLGAVRHKGFIPWDDDIDLALLWPRITSHSHNTFSFCFCLSSIDSGT